MSSSYQPWEKQSNSNPEREQHVQRPSPLEEKREATQCTCLEARERTVAVKCGQGMGLGRPWDEELFFIFRELEIL